MTLYQPPWHKLPDNTVDELGQDWAPVFQQLLDAPTMTIAYTDADEHFSDAWVAAQLSGSVAFQHSLYETENWHELIAQDVATEAQLMLEQHGIDGHEAQHDPLFEELTNRISVHPRYRNTREDSMINNIPRQLMRWELFGGHELLQYNYDTAHDTHRWAQHANIAALLATRGIDMSQPTNQHAVADLVNHSPEHWHEGMSLDVIWYGHVADAIPTDELATITFQDPYVVLIDTANGAGYDAQLVGSLTCVRGTRVQSSTSYLPAQHRAWLDHMTGSYGWDEIAGVVKPAYANDPIVTIVDPTVSSAQKA